ncbi:hypothetical protein ACFL1C_02985 [Pseudomonadota bacterium]
MKMLRTVTVNALMLALLLPASALNADEDKSGIPFRVSALEEMVIQQQDQIEALSKWVVVDSNKTVIGKVVSFTSRANVLVVETEIDGEVALLWINSGGWIFRNSELVFALENCEGEAFAVEPGDWWFRQVVIAVGPGQDNSAVPYKVIGEPVDEHWFSHILPDGQCENAEFDARAASVERLADDLYVTYPRAPDRWSLEAQ